MTTDANFTGDPGPVYDWEELGRWVFSSWQMKRAANTGVPADVFLVAIGKRDISVDRITRAPPSVAVANAEKAGAKREPARTFYGWAVVNKEQVTGLGCCTIASPSPCNPYHADIVLPDVAMESADEQRQYATKLARRAKWKPHPATGA